MTQMRPLIRSARFSPDGKRLLTGSHSGVLAEWDAASGQRLRALLDLVGNEDLLAEPFSPGAEKKQASFPDGHPMETIRGCGITAVCYSADGGRLHAIAGNGMAASWGAADGEALHAWRAHEDDEEAFVMGASPDNRWLATGCKKAGTTTLRVWKVAEDRLAPPVEAFSSELMVGGVFALAFSPDSRFLASGGWGNSGYSAPMIYDVTTGERVSTLLFDASRAICFSPDGKRLATGDEFGLVSIWDLESRARISEKQGHDTIVSALRFSPDGRHLVSGSCDGSLMVWYGSSGGFQDQYGYDGMILDCSFTADGSGLAIAVGSNGVERPGFMRFPL